MSLLLVLVLALQPTSPAAEVQEEILVIGQKLKAWSARVESKNGVHRCKIKKSTGDTAIDAIGCTALTECVTKMQPQFQALQDKTLTRDRRKAFQAKANEEFTNCTFDRRSDLIAELADKRAEARQ